MVDHLAGAALTYAVQNPRTAATHATSVAGRLLGLGGADIDAVRREGLPAWTYVALGLVAGLGVGVYVATRHADRLPRLVRGSGR